LPAEKNADASAYGIVDVNESNVNEYDVLCLKSKKNGEGYRSKIEWIREWFKEGLRLKLLLVKERRGFTSRGFIEYVPGQYAWRGISARGYMVIHCIWVIGRNRGKGYGTKLLELCLNDAKGMNGVAVVTTESTWLPRKDLFIKNGFEKVDAMPPYLELYAKRFSNNAPLPKFNPIPKERLKKYGSGITVFKADQCPYTSAAVRVALAVAEEAGLPARVVHVESCREAQNGVHPYGTYCVLLNGKVLTYRPIGKKGLLEDLQKAS
jgi:N-acetylglutamate synthase-like GNAT family acetyltransferase